MLHKWYKKLERENNDVNNMRVDWQALPHVLPWCLCPYLTHEGRYFLWQLHYSRLMSGGLGVLLAADVRWPDGLSLAALLTAGQGCLFAVLSRVDTLSSIEHDRLPFSIIFHTPRVFFSYSAYVPSSSPCFQNSIEWRKISVG